MSKILDFENYFNNDIVKLDTYTYSFEECLKQLVENKSICDCASYIIKNNMSDRVKISNCDIATNFQASDGSRLKLVLNNDNDKFVYINRFTIIPSMISRYTCLEIVSEGKCNISYDAYLCQTDIRKNWITNTKLIKSSGLTFFNGVCCRI
jgi:hypothetical protein